MTASEVRDRIVELASAEGGWGYSVNQPAHIEPTCLALIALHADHERYKSAIEGGLRAVTSHAAPDGSYRLTRGRPQAVWPTALAMFALTTTSEHSDFVRRAAAKLLSTRGEVVKLDPELDDMLDIDLELIGWPWAEGNFAWVEPTAWACLALRAGGYGQERRVQQGLRLLLDRAFDRGGTNYGNKTILGKTTDPIPGTTALMLLALQGLRDEPRVDAAIDYLRNCTEHMNDLEHLAWSRIALSCHESNDDNQTLLPRLDASLRKALERELAADNGLRAGPCRLALAALALDADLRNPFRLSDKPEPSGESPPPEEPRRPVSKISLGERLKSKFRGLFVSGLGRLRPLPPTSAVHVACAQDYDDALVETLHKQFDHFRRHVPVNGKRVLLKPNLVEYHRDKVINTDPRFISAVIELFQREGASEIIVAEGPGHWRNVNFLVNESGLGDVLRRHGVRFVDINHDEPVKIINLGRATGLDHLYLSRTVLSADVFVSLPKLKTHHWAGATLSLKNLFGTLPGICYGWPKNELHWRGIPQSIVDIALTHTPHLAIIDGIVGMEGDGPLNGTPKKVGAVIMGCDLVAVDATGCRLMGLPTERIPTLVLAANKRLGQLKEGAIPQIGLPITALKQQFDWPPQLEKQLLRESVR